MKQVSTPFYVGPGALVSSSSVEDRAPVDRYRATIVRDDPGRRIDDFTFSVCVVEATSEAEAFELLVPPTGFRGEDAEEELAWSPIFAPVMRLYLHRISAITPLPKRVHLDETRAERPSVLAYKDDGRPFHTWVPWERVDRRELFSEHQMTDPELYTKLEDTRALVGGMQ
ncbi:hypothetical protein [Kocuria rosea]|uniref:Uncharacterized protein n=1 Tax=Kocuria rosea TaxID=1275 RepID=A0A4R5Y2H2_KOCRO|nr:hypothetical protein [Kocuria rosea]TDL38583.1 hypothetical protein E2R59_16890 [Kocuria rosea]